MLLRDILIGFAFYLVIEGLVYALAPSFLQSMARHIPEIGENKLRAAGVIAVALGVGLVWLARF